MKVSRDDVLFTRNQIYSSVNKKDQDTKISHLLKVASPKRDRKMKQTIRIKYIFWNTNRQACHQVCQKFFLKALNLSQRRVITIAKQVKSGTGIVENRGGDRKSHLFGSKRAAVVHFIGSLRGTESHYSRTKSQRIYLSSELNISKLFVMYNNKATDRLRVKRSFFYHIFNTKFNLGFGSPATDVCTFCYRLKNFIKFEKENNASRNAIISQLRIHKLSAKQFNIELKNSPDNSVSYCFDLQQIQMLPKLPIQEAFYASQLALYNFCIMDLQTQTPDFYSWIECQASRGPNEIGSALYNFLNKTDFPPDTQILRLFCDGCSGQNKNSFIIHLLQYWLFKKAPPTIKTVLLIFPVRGHSFLPADRVFGRIEKLTRKKTEIVTKEEYWDIFREIGNVNILGVDWDLYNIKENISGSFKKVDNIREAKRIYIDKTCTKGKQTLIRTRSEPFYRNDLFSEGKSLLKSGKSFGKINLTKIHLEKPVKKKKLKDIEALLRNSYGEEWDRLDILRWYKDLFTKYQDDVKTKEGEEEGDGEESECDCMEEDNRLKM